MGEIFVRGDEWDRRIRTDDPNGTIEIDLTGDCPEVVVPDGVSVRERDYAADWPLPGD